MIGFYGCVNLKTPRNTSAALLIINYLDVTFDLRFSSCKPFMKPCMKPGNTLQYDHPLSNLEAIKNRLSNISSDEQAFNPACPPYQDALDKIACWLQL